MKIDFENIEEALIPNFKGGELEYRTRRYSDGRNCIMKGCLVPGASIGLHRHDDTCEFIIVTAGEGTAIIDGTEEKLTPGQCHYCPKGSTHTLKNLSSENLEFYAIVPLN